MKFGLYQHMQNITIKT